MSGMNSVEVTLARVLNVLVTDEEICFGISSHFMKVPSVAVGAPFVQ